MTKLPIFNEVHDPRGWDVVDGETGDRLGTIEWHDRLGAFGYAADPASSFDCGPDALASIGRFLDDANK